MPTTYAGRPIARLFVPSRGSTSQVHRPSSAPLVPPAAARTRCPGNAAWSSSTMRRSAARSSSLTTSPDASLRRTATAPPRQARSRINRPAPSAARTATRRAYWRSTLVNVSTCTSYPRSPRICGSHPVRDGPGRPDRGLPVAALPPHPVRVPVDRAERQVAQPAPDPTQRHGSGLPPGRGHGLVKVAGRQGVRLALAVDLDVAGGPAHQPRGGPDLVHLALAVHLVDPVRRVRRVVGDLDDLVADLAEQHIAEQVPAV